MGMALGHHLEGVGHPHGKDAAVDNRQGSRGHVSHAGGFDSHGRYQTGGGADHELDERQPQGIGFGREPSD